MTANYALERTFAARKALNAALEGFGGVSFMFERSLLLLLVLLAGCSKQEPVKLDKLAEVKFKSADVANAASTVIFNRFNELAPGVEMKGGVVNEEYVATFYGRKSQLGGAVGYLLENRCDFKVLIGENVLIGAGDIASADLMNADDGKYFQLGFISDSTERISKASSNLTGLYAVMIFDEKTIVNAPIKGALVGGFRFPATMFDVPMNTLACLRSGPLPVAIKRDSDGVYKAF